MGDLVEPLGKSGDERAFRVTVNGDVAIVFRNEAKDKVFCQNCKSGNCIHVDYVDAYFTIEVYPYVWSQHLAYYYSRPVRTNWRRIWMTITGGLLSNGHPVMKAIREQEHRINSLYEKNGMDFMSRYPEKMKQVFAIPEVARAREKLEQMRIEWKKQLIDTINFHLEHMSIQECGYLYLTFRPTEVADIDDNLLHPNWANGIDWVMGEPFWQLYENDIMYMGDKCEPISLNIVETYRLDVGDTYG